MSYIGPWTREALNACITEFQKPKVREQITNKVINPIVKEISAKLLPYFATLLILQVIIITLVIYVLKSS